MGLLLTERIKTDLQVRWGRPGVLFWMFEFEMPQTHQSERIRPTVGFKTRVQENGWGWRFTLSGGGIQLVFRTTGNG